MNSPIYFFPEIKFRSAADLFEEEQQSQGDKHFPSNVVFNLICDAEVERRLKDADARIGRFVHLLNR